MVVVGGGGGTHFCKSFLFKSFSCLCLLQSVASFIMPAAPSAGELMHDEM